MKKSGYTGVVGGDSKYPLIFVRGGVISEAKSAPISNLTGSNITSISLGTKFGGGNITTTGRIELQPSGVNPDVYGSSSDSLNITMDDKGYVTNIITTPTIASDGYGERTLTSSNFTGKIKLRYYIFNSRITFKIIANDEDYPFTCTSPANFVSDENIYEISPYKDLDFEVLCLPITGYNVSRLRVYITKFGGISISGFSTGVYRFETDYITYSSDANLFTKLASGVIDPIYENGSAWEGTYPQVTMGNVRLEWERFYSFVKGKLVANLTFIESGVFRGATNESYLNSGKSFNIYSPNIDYSFIVP